MQGNIRRAGASWAGCLTREGRGRLGAAGALGLLGLLSLGAGGCASARVRQVAAWEVAGDDAALKRALEDGSPQVRQAAAAAFVRYGAYDTGRPPVLGTLGKSQSAEAKEAARKLFGVPPQHTPDPQGSGAPAGQAVVYLYRPVDDRGEARWLRFDDGSAAKQGVRLRPGQFVRLVVELGLHRIAIELPDHEAAPTDDPGETYGQMHKTPPMQLSISTPASGVYFVREVALRGQSKPDVKVVPVPVGLAAVSALKPVAAADRDPAP